MTDQRGNQKVNAHQEKALEIKNRPTVHKPVKTTLQRQAIYQEKENHPTDKYC